MSELDMPEVLNTHFACTQCHANARWVRTARPPTRRNSCIHRLQCAQCGAQIVAKASRGRTPDSNGCAELREEYETPRALQPAFDACERSGTLQQLGFLSFAHHGVLLTGFLPGADAESTAANKVDTWEY